jgi:hypothetical protein
MITRTKKGEAVSGFGSGGLFLCYVITMLLLTLVFGWPALEQFSFLCSPIAAVYERVFYVVAGEA